MKDEEEKRPILTQAYLKHMCKSDQKTYYSTPEVNDVLYLQDKGFKYIRNMDMFPDLKCLYFLRNGKCFWQAIHFYLISIYFYRLQKFGWSTIVFKVNEPLRE